MFSASLLTTLILALTVAANPVLLPRSPVTLPLSKRVNATNMVNLVKHDVARAAALRARGLAKANGQFSFDASTVNEPVENQAVTYVANIGVGSPPTEFSLIVDTGSSNTWVGADKSNPYVRTTTSKTTTSKVSVTYGSGSFSGSEFVDQVTITSGLVISSQSIGVASTSTGFGGVDGIIGIGPVDLTEDTLSTGGTIPTVTDNAFKQGLIPADVLGISFVPTTTDPNVNGEITWGGTDSAKFIAPITFTPLTRTSPASEFWGINQVIKYGTTTILSSTAGIVDTGTTLVLIATNAFNAYQKATGGVLDDNTGLLRITSTQFSNLQSLSFTPSGGKALVLTPNAQIWPRALNADIGGVAGDIYLIVADIGTPSGEGLDFINGMTFLERFYAVFDTTNKQVGFATTSFTSSTIN